MFLNAWHDVTETELNAAISIQSLTRSHPLR